MEPHPIRMVVDDDLRRSRLTVFFRLGLAIPHFVWLAIWLVGALYLVAPIAWLLTLILGRLPEPLWRFFSSFVRYTTHVLAFVLLAGNPFPGFTGHAGTYPVDLEIDPPVRQHRLKTLFRLILALPAQLLAAWLLVVPMFGTVYDETTGQAGAYFYLTGVGFVVAVLAWFACMVRGRMPTGFRDLLAYSLRFNAQTWGYLFLVTDRYPDADPGEPAPEPPPYRPVAVALGDDDLRRSRLTVFFRLLLALPHLVWLVLWSVAAIVVIVLGWFATLAMGRLPMPFHRFLAAWLRYQVHVYAFLTLVANPFPGFAGATGSYPVDVRVDPPERQHRLKTLFRLVLAYPANLVAWTLTGALWIVALFGWFVGLALGRMPRGLRGLGAFALGYGAQTTAYLSLLTDRYPYSGPPWVDAPPEPEPLFAWPGPLRPPSLSA
jgi:Domain of unknown function (DUF4389)